MQEYLFHSSDDMTETRCTGTSRKEQHMLIPETVDCCFETMDHQTAADANTSKCTIYSGVQRRVQGQAEHSRSKYSQA